jgi:hypothetical protein
VFRAASGTFSIRFPAGRRSTTAKASCGTTSAAVLLIREASTSSELELQEWNRPGVLADSGMSSYAASWQFSPRPGTAAANNKLELLLDGKVISTDGSEWWRIHDQLADRQGVGLDSGMPVSVPDLQVCRYEPVRGWHGRVARRRQDHPALQGRGRLPGHLPLNDPPLLPPWAGRRR